MSAPAVRREGLLLRTPAPFHASVFHSVLDSPPPLPGAVSGLLAEGRAEGRGRLPRARTVSTGGGCMRWEGPGQAHGQARFPLCHCPVGHLGHMPHLSRLPSPYPTKWGSGRPLEPQTTPAVGLLRVLPWASRPRCSGRQTLTPPTSRLEVDRHACERMLPKHQPDPLDSARGPPGPAPLLSGQPHAFWDFPMVFQRKGSHPRADSVEYGGSWELLSVRAGAPPIPRAGREGPEENPAFSGCLLLRFVTGKMGYSGACPVPPDSNWQEAVST